MENISIGDEKVNIGRLIECTQKVQQSSKFLTRKCYQNFYSQSIKANNTPDTAKKI